jgi:hypothetical protein
MFPFQDGSSKIQSHKDADPCGLTWFNAYGLFDNISSHFTGVIATGVFQRWGELRRSVKTFTTKDPEDAEKGGIFVFGERGKNRP